VLEEMETGPGFNNIVERGRDMVALKLAEVKRTIQQTAYFVRYRGEKIPVVNSVNCVDDICAQYGPKYPFVIVWHGISGARFKYSLRTARNDVHVGEIAKSFGGGGRQKSAAFYSEFGILRLAGITYCDE
jgi:nanoRNase/pAp phosphatase (c-di-AMP/oligoRNAs hydrolase)